MPHWVGWVLVAVAVGTVGLWFLGQLTGAVNAVDYGVRWVRRRLRRNRAHGQPVPGAGTTGSREERPGEETRTRS